MRAAAITEEILDINPLHPGALHYNMTLERAVNKTRSRMAVDAIRESAG